MYNIVHTLSVAFFGHRRIDNMHIIEPLLENHVRNIIDEYDDIHFIVGRNGDFDRIVSSCIRRVKKNYRDDNSTHFLLLPYVTAEFRDNQESFEKYYDLIGLIEAHYKMHPKRAITQRNREMVDMANLIICYCERESGGAYQAVKYALKQGKRVINLVDEIEEEIY